MLLLIYLILLEYFGVHLCAYYQCIILDNLMFTIFTVSFKMLFTCLQHSVGK